MLNIELVARHVVFVCLEEKKLMSKTSSKFNGKAIRSLKEVRKNCC